jgi:hypothetical protein
MRSSIRFAGIRFAGLAVAATALVAATTAEASRTAAVTHHNGRTVVSAPMTHVVTTPAATKVRVDAPYTTVRVDTGAGHVRIRVPGFNGDISW